MKEIPYDEVFQFVGLQVVANPIRVATAGFTTTANLGGQPEVATVEPNSEAQRLGITVGDRVASVNGGPAQAYLDEELARLTPGTVVHLQLENRRGKREVDLHLSSRQEQSYELRDLPSITTAQRDHRAAWLHGEDEAGSAH